MSMTTTQRIQHNGRSSPNTLMTAYAGDLLEALASARNEERQRCVEVVLSRNLPYGRDNQLLNEIADAILAPSSHIDELQAARDFHPRAMELISTFRPFIVVAKDEPYFMQVYGLIREHEKAKGRWTDEDEDFYQQAMKEG